MPEDNGTLASLKLDTINLGTSRFKWFSDEKGVGIVIRQADGDITVQYSDLNIPMPPGAAVPASAGLVGRTKSSADSDQLF